MEIPSPHVNGVTFWVKAESESNTMEVPEGKLCWLTFSIHRSGLRNWFYLTYSDVVFISNPLLSRTVYTETLTKFATKKWAKIEVLSVQVCNNTTGPFKVFITIIARQSTTAKQHELHSLFKAEARQICLIYELLVK